MFSGFFSRLLEKLAAILKHIFDIKLRETSLDLNAFAGRCDILLTFTLYYDLNGLLKKLNLKHRFVDKKNRHVELRISVAGSVSP